MSFFDAMQQQYENSRDRFNQANGFLANLMQLKMNSMLEQDRLGLDAIKTAGGLESDDKGRAITLLNYLLNNETARRETDINAETSKRNTDINAKTSLSTSGMQNNVEREKLGFAMSQYKDAQDLAQRIFDKEHLYNMARFNLFSPLAGRVYQGYMNQGYSPKQANELTAMGFKKGPKK